MTKHALLHLATLSLLACFGAGCAAESDEASEESETESEEAVATTSDAITVNGTVSIGSVCTATPEYAYHPSTNHFYAGFGLRCSSPRDAQYTVCFDRYTSSGWQSVVCSGWKTRTITDSRWLTFQEKWGLANGTYRGRLNFWTAAGGWRTAKTSTVNL